MNLSTTAATAQGKQEFRGVQALRALAALTVVAGHSTDFLLRANGSLPLAFRYIHGPAGVDIFFVISGFVMALSSQRLRVRPHPARLFLLRRIIRIVPLYWLLTIAKYLATSADPAWSVNGRPRWTELLWSLLFLPYRSQDGGVHPLIPVGWTLSFEMLFYLVFAGALMVRNGYRSVLVPVIVSIAVMSALRQPGWPLWTTLIDPIVLEFLAGFAIAMLTMRSALPRRGMGVAFLLFGAAMLVLTIPNPTPPIMRPLLWGGGAAALVLGTAVLEPLLGPRLPAWVLLLGDASYSIYLVQSFVFPVLHWALHTAAPELVHRRPAITGLAMLLAGVVLTAAAGVASYRWLEQPMTRRLRRWIDVQRPTPVAP